MAPRAAWAALTSVAAAALALSTSTTLAAPSGTALGVWVAEHELSAPGSSAGSPSVAADEALRTTVVWRALDGGHWRVQEAHRSPTREWTPVATLSPADLDASDPQVSTMGPGAGARAYRLVAWLSGPAGHASLVASVQTGGGPWSPPLTLAGPVRQARDPVVLAGRWVDDSGGCYDCGGPDDRNLPIVFWRDFDGTSWRVRAAMLEEDGSAVSIRRTLSRAGGDARDLHLLGASRYSNEVSWTRWNGAHWRAETAYFEEWLPDAVVDLPYFGEEQLDPRAGPSGAVWTNEAGGLTRLRGLACLYESGEACSKPVTLSSPGADVTAVLTYAEVPPQAVAVWQEQQPGGPVRVMYAVAAEEGSWGPTTALSAAGVDTGPAAVSAPTTSYPLLAVWSRRSPDPGVEWSMYGPRVEEWSTPRPMDGIAPEEVAGLDAGAPGAGFGPSAVAWAHSVGDDTRVVARGLDWRPPDLTRLDLRPRVLLGGRATLAWGAGDDWSQVASYDVRQTVKLYGQRSGTTTMLLPRTGATEHDLTGLVPGGDYCFAVRARDTVGHLGSWEGAWPCLQVPLDDRILTRVTTGWSRVYGSQFYRGSTLTTSRHGARLRLDARPGSTSIKLVVATGPGMGRLRATLGSRTRVVDLASATRATRVLRTIFRSDGPFLAGTLTLEVTSSGKPVRVDGVLLDRESL